jgi:ABC-2 type transport system permease protein
MNEIWRERSKKYQLMVMKYLKYVLNDHLILALLFFVGGLGLAYSNWLKTLQPTTWYLQPLLLIVGILLTMVGRPVLLLEKPDAVFLIAQEKKIDTYLKKSLRRTSFSTLGALFIGLIVVFPLLAVTYHDLLATLSWCIMAVLGSFSNVFLKYQRLYFDSKWNNQIGQLLMIAIILGVGTVMIPQLGLALMLITIIFRVLQLKRTFKQNRFDWQTAIQLETNRMGQLYQFFSLFTTVKQVPVKVKRRQYADGLIRFLAGKANVFTFLYPRIIIRSGNQGSLMLRLLLVGMLIEVYSTQVPLKIAIGALTTYLIVIQLVDVYRPVHENVFVKIYPVAPIEAEKGLLSVMKRIILISAIFLTVAGLITNFSISYLVISVVTQAFVALVLLKWFIPRYIKKSN